MMMYESAMGATGPKPIGSVRRGRERGNLIIDCIYLIRRWRRCGGVLNRKGKTVLLALVAHRLRLSLTLNQLYQRSLITIPSDFDLFTSLKLVSPPPLVVPLA